MNESRSHTWIPMSSWKTTTENESRVIRLDSSNNSGTWYASGCMSWLKLWLSIPSDLSEITPRAKKEVVGRGVKSDTLKYIIVKGLSLPKCIQSLGLKFLQIYQCRKTRNQCPMCVFWTQFCIYYANWDMCKVCPCLITDLVSIDARFYHWMNICVNLLFIVTSICRSLHLCQFILSILRSAVSTDSNVNHCQS